MRYFINTLLQRSFNEQVCSRPTAAPPRPPTQCQGLTQDPHPQSYCCLISDTVTGFSSNLLLMFKKTDNKTEKTFIVIHLCKDFQQKNVFYFGNTDFDMSVCMYVCMYVCMSVCCPLIAQKLLNGFSKSNRHMFKYGPQ